MPEIDVDIAIGGTRYFPVAAGSGGGNVCPGKSRIMGWSLHETTGLAGAAFTLSDGTNQVVHVEMAAKGVDTQWFGPQGIICQGNITLAVTSGSVDGSVFFIDEY